MAEWKMIRGWEMVAGLEVHAELKTRTKIFCGCATTYGAEPNTQCCPVCMGYPGTLPRLNGQAVRMAALAGLALDGQVNEYSAFDRKNYFYPDLPKAYQITQQAHPICLGGGLTIETAAGEKRIGITRIHLEEDAGKLLHSPEGTLIDCNRCGVPLIEIVSEPDIRTPAEAAAYLRKLRAVLLCIGVSDCRMNEGSLRCDVNLSIRKAGQPMGTRTEMKNLNSFQSVQRAMEAEYLRQVETAEKGEPICQETRRFDQKTGMTYLMRRKENASDYRYFPEPDLPPVRLKPAQIDAWRRELPPLPDQRKARYMAEFALPAWAAEQIAGEKALAEYFEAVAASTGAVKTMVNLMTTEVFRLLGSEGDVPPVAPGHLGRIADMVEAGEINGGAAKKVIAALWQQDEDPAAYVARNKLGQISDEAALQALARQAVEEHPDMVEKYRKGKASMKKALMGAAMGLCGGRANPAMLQRLMDTLLDA